MASQFGVGAGSGYLYNMEKNDGNFQTIYATGAEGSLAEGVDQVSFHRTAPVVASSDASIALQTSADTELSDGGTAKRYAVAAQSGNVALVGDTSFLEGANLRDADNEVFVGNLAEFLVGGSVEEDALEPMAEGESSPEQSQANRTTSSA
ncbi:hypothetical protein C441_04029 [Haloferax sulfurifontis ATCC BAA-897]|uniref:Uncharacterized protein n=2 Tax=Haloferax sulfurifontis TaxID=255616 RepID=M0ILE3_9EURY|nr:hypothetical protein C441_04029 [Haloferax sulfurifontis ATCC BAA-897]